MRSASAYWRSSLRRSGGHCGRSRPKPARSDARPHVRSPRVRSTGLAMPDFPDFRLTVRRDTVLAIDWHPFLVSGGPMTAMLHSRGRAGVAIADLTVIHEDESVAEAVVRFLTGDRPRARAAITRWARDVGYRRLWLPGEVVELPGPAEARAETRCSGCGVRLYDDGPDFWDHVREAGRFPAACPLCGADPPQWRGGQEPPAAGGPTGEGGASAKSV